MAPMLIQELDEDANASPAEISLEPVEQTLKTLLLDVADYIDETNTTSDPITQAATPVPESLANEKVILRFTGGWVRDKLLGVPSHDIDVAINNMTGYQFGLKLKEYLEVPGNLSKYGLEDIAGSNVQSQEAGASTKSKSVGGLHKIEANPEKSKHLETTTLRILGLDVDLVNLRKETYTDDSRNPQMEFGTPEEDALRRDATINAMFYNITTSEVEDFTGRGRDDMAKRIIRTPLEPNQTFVDDPLRVLRLIRFASRLDYQIDEETLAAMRNDEIKAALHRKISRERVGMELEKALHGPRPHEALRLIFELGLYETIYCDPALKESDHFTPSIDNWRVILDTLDDLTRDGQTLSINLLHDADEQYLAWNLAALIPYRDAPLPVATEQSRRLPPHISVAVTREGIKAPNKISDVINVAIQHRDDISRLVDNLFQQKRRPNKAPTDGQDFTARDLLGMSVRRWGSSWRSQVVYAMLVEVADEPDSIDGIMRKYELFVKTLGDLDLLNVCSVKPMLDGKAIAKALDTPPGPWMKDALEVVMAWQLRHPGVTDREAAIEEVRKHRQNGELASDLVRHFLKLTVRPLFVKASPEKVTEQGRKVATATLPKKITAESMDDTIIKPWKSAKDAYVLRLLRWIVQSLDTKLLEEVWPLIVPPLLTMIDDWEAKYKRIGAELLNSVLQTTPPALLERTGLGEVFEDALLPCLTFLPTIVEVEESAALLSTVYPCLLTLCDVRYPDTPNVASSTQQSTPLSSPARIPSPAKTHSLDLILRKGILYALSNPAGPGQRYPRLQRVLFTQLGPVLQALGLETVRHLRYLVPPLADALSDPLAVAVAPEVARAANQALQVLLRVAWPRTAPWRAEILRGLIGCWGALGGKGGEVERRELRKELKETVRLLKIAVERECDFDAECRVLVEADARLVGLLGENGGLESVSSGK